MIKKKTAEILVRSSGKQRPCGERLHKRASTRRSHVKMTNIMNKKKLPTIHVNKRNTKEILSSAASKSPALTCNIASDSSLAKDTRIP